MNTIQYNLLLLNNTQITVSVERKKIKNHYIKIFPNLKVVACFPLNMELNLIYSFIFAGSSHDKYQYHEEITKQELFKNNKLVINSQKCYSYYLINYFSDLEEE